MINLITAAFIAITGVVYGNILTKPNALLNGFYLRMWQLFKNDERQNAGKPLHPLFMVIIGCYICVSGQMALWYYIAFTQSYDVREHIFFTATTIYMAVLANKLIKTE